MCLIVKRPEGHKFDRSLVPTIFENNPDGFGIMVPYNGRVLVEKTTGTLEDCLRLYDKWEHMPAGMHWRWRTHGDLDLENCHPYEVLNVEKHGMDLFLMHNGVMSKVPTIDWSKSDTWHFIEYVLRPMLVNQKDLLWDKDFLDFIGDMIGINNKLLMLTGDGDFITVNEKSGTERKGCWLSNTYSLASSHRVPTHGGGYYYGRSYDDYYDYLYGKGGVVIGGKTGVKSAAESAATFCSEGTNATGRSSAVGEGQEPEGKVETQTTGDEAIRQAVIAHLAKEQSLVPLPERHVPRLSDEEDDIQYGSEHGLIDTYLLSSLSETEIFQLVIDQPDEITDWIIKQVR